MLHADGNVYNQKESSGYSTPIRPIEATGICIVGMEPYESKVMRENADGGRVRDPRP